MKLFRNPLLSCHLCTEAQEKGSDLEPPSSQAFSWVHSEQSLQQVQGVPLASSRPRNTKPAAGNGDVTTREFSDWFWRVWFGCVISLAGSSQSLEDSGEQLQRPPRDQDAVQQSSDSGGPRPEHHAQPLRR